MSKIISSLNLVVIYLTEIAYPTQFHNNWMSDYVCTPESKQKPVYDEWAIHHRCVLTSSGEAA